jgi:hypothetical protein
MPEDSFSKMQSLELPQRVDWSATRNSLPILDDGVDAETEAYTNIRAAYLRMDEWCVSLEPSAAPDAAATTRARCAQDIVLNKSLERLELQRRICRVL